ncbi:MAG: GNAT family N-acetyltransferase [Clostridia bacterium]|nr:GNAT family N-acetyltransferase [Clostridia bacterium]
MDITIRNAVKQDIEDILRIQKKAFAFQAKKYNDYEMPPMVETYEDVLKDIENQMVFVAVLDSKIVGSVRVIRNQDEAEIKRLAVDDDYHNNGIGHMLMDIAELQHRELKRLWLLTGSESYKSINMYKKLGYEIYKEADHKDYKLVYLQKFL